MPRLFKRTSAPAPMEIPPPPPPAPGAHPVPSSATPSTFRPGAWCPPCPPQSMASSSNPYWITGLQHPGMVGSMPQGPWCAPASFANMEDSDLQVFSDVLRIVNIKVSFLLTRGVDYTPPGGLLNFLNKNTPRHGPSQVVINGSSSQPISVGDDTGSDCPRTEKRMLWTKDEDIILVGAWVNNSNDPIHANYKKNDQYWKEVTAAYNSATPKNRARLMKCIKDRFGRIKKRVAWFCGSWKEANALWASGESDVNLMDRALKLYEEEHKKDGPFMFKHCWDVLHKEPKWDAYLERLANLDPEKRRFNLDDDMGQHFPIDDDKEERPMGGKKAKELQKRKRKDQSCVIDLEDELQLFLDAQNKANEGRNEMLETQRRVSSENLEARKLSYLAAKESKEAAMLETYRELLKQDTTLMAEDVRAEHVLALRCFREKLFGNTN
ncbi:hypothetical protein HU200_045406 [Digitaria exilis]|uniref:No apical meristem-associated C-terminal domain-containing protein n=1 Tax=Digitaria exilis TaxID=1010633 RepID=A0A835EAI6_9POAL|nr:hypothetical protein HU200_045406 [Digitaria exilis]CAB3499037.1 unnamed protein product [Digitaria exilis]